MSQSLAAVYIHSVFSTKGRRPFLADATMRNALHACLSNISAQHDCPAIRVGGVADHVHVLARLGRSITQADWVKKLKRASALWLKQQSREYADFQWQGGYANFSVGQSELNGIIDYIANQETHHRRADFQSELLALLRAHHVEFDERYLWD